MTPQLPAGVLAWLLALAPALPFVAVNLSYRRILRQKRNEMVRRFQNRGELESAHPYGTVEELTKLVGEFYDWRTYVAPLVLTSLMAIVFAIIGLTMVGVSFPAMPTEFSALVRDRAPAAMMAGAGGAYLWGLYDVLRRHGSADLSSTALHFTWLGIAVSAAIGPLLAQIFAEDAAVSAAFALGALPLRDIRRWTTNRFLEKGTITAQGSTLRVIQGITPSARDRLLDEEIDSVQRLAFADPIRLLFRTNIEWHVILDLIDQAFLANIVGEKIDALRPLGVRGAIDVAELYHRKDDNDDDGKNARRLFELIGQKLGEGPDAAYNVAYACANDPIVDFIWVSWTAAYRSDGDRSQPSAPELPDRDRPS